MKRTYKVVFLILTLVFLAFLNLVGCSKEHKCTFSEDWQHDETNHWHVCVDENCDEKSGLEKHNFTSSVTKEATYEEKGVKTYTCECGYSYTEEIPALVHNYSTQWSHDETNHYYLCTDEGYETLKKDEAVHSFTSTVTKEASFEEKGVKTYTCECGYSYTEEIPALVHTYGTEWSYDETNHFHQCTDKGYEKLRKDETAHNFTATVTKEPTYTEEGVRTYTCECGYSYTEAIPVVFNPYEFKNVDLNNIPYQLVNGDFEDGYNGWYMSDADKAAYTINNSPTDLWGNAVYATNNYLYGYTIESAKVVFHSSLFKLGGVGLITFKMAGNGTDDLKVTLKQYNPNGEATEITCFNNWYFTKSNESGFIFRKYFLEIDMAKYKDAICYFEVSDQKENTFGFICLDDIVTYYEALPKFEGAWFKAAFVTEPENATVVPKDNNPEPTNEYQLVNGDFENGWEGWNVDDNVKSIYSIYNSPTDLWGNQTGFTGNYLYGFNNEAGTITFTSKTFKVGGTGLITFRMAGNCTDTLQLVLMQKVADGDDVEIAKFNNWYFGTVQESGFISHLYYYQVDLAKYKDCEFYFKVVDNATANFGFISLDDIVTYYEKNPELDASYNKAGFVTKPND